MQQAEVEVYALVRNRYQLLSPNAQGRFAIEELGVELGIWEGTYQNVELPWLRWWDVKGDLLLAGSERADEEHQARRDAIPRLLGMGLTPEQVAEALGLSMAEVEGKAS